MNQIFQTDLTTLPFKLTEETAPRNSHLATRNSQLSTSISQVATRNFTTRKIPSPYVKKQKKSVKIKHNHDQ